jgi:hypothetical protein
MVHENFGCPQGENSNNRGDQVKFLIYHVPLFCPPCIRLMKNLKNSFGPSCYRTPQKKLWSPLMLEFLHFFLHYYVSEGIKRIFFYNLYYFVSCCVFWRLKMPDFIEALNLNEPLSNTGYTKEEVLNLLHDHNSDFVKAAGNRKVKSVSLPDFFIPKFYFQCCNF